MLRDRLVAIEKHHLSLKTNQFVKITSKLDAMSPLKVLSRGYAMAMDDGGSIIRSVHDVAVGDRVRISFADGHVDATVNHTEEENNGK